MMGELLAQFWKLALAFVLTLLLVALGIGLLAGKACAQTTEHGVRPTHCAHPHRRQAPINEFKRTHACPVKCRTYTWDEPAKKFRLYQVCGACQVDHKCALACGGPDTPDNMQWLTSKENRAKSDDCRLCAGLKLECVP